MEYPDFPKARSHIPTRPANDDLKSFFEAV